jgi:O-antigen ligase
MAELITIFLIVVGVVFCLTRPLKGLMLIVFMVYFPIFSIFKFGPLSISVSTLPVLALFIRALHDRDRSPEKYPISAWQWLVMASMVAAFILVTISSSAPTKSLVLLPNLIMYVMLIFSVIVLVRQPEEFLILAKTILVLTLIDTIIPQLAPVAKLLSTKLLGINGIALKYYFAFAIGMVFLTQPNPYVSRLWRLLGGAVALLVMIRLVIFQTRAAWLAIVVILVLLTILLPRRAVLIGMIAVLGGIALFSYRDVIKQNILETQSSVTALRINSLKPAGEDDRIRLVSLQVGKHLFQERPILGWGPNIFPDLIKRTANAPEKYVTGGAFNSWLMLFAETGLVGGLPVMLAFAFPIIYIILRFNSVPGDIRYLYLAFAMGLLATAIHLLFIDLMYTSQVWLHLGLTMAGVQAIKLSNLVTLPSKTKQKTMRTRAF